MNSKNIEDIYPLSPTQQGILFHSLYAPNVGVYCGQMSFIFHGNLDISAFERAWQQVLERHPILRTAFVWENQQLPLQVVGQYVKLPCQQYDWRKLSPTEQQKQLKTFLQADRHQGFQLSKAPLMRITLIHLRQDEYQFIWSYHHLLLDGWSGSLLLKEVIAFYKAFRQGQDLYLERPRLYKDYIAWLQQQNSRDAEFFWRDLLQGINAPTSLGIDRDNSVSDYQKNYDELQTEISKVTTTALHSLAKQHHLTVNTLVQGAWALLLSRYSREKDVVFGTTVSGRPSTLVGSESTIGLFINTLPVRVNVNPEESLISWLKQLQCQQVYARQYEYSSLVDIQGWSEIPRGLPLFESIIVFENYPVESLLEPSLDLEISNFNSFEKTNYPLTLSAIPGEKLLLKIAYDEGERFDAATIGRMLQHLEILLKAMIANPQQRLKELSILTEVEQHQLLVEWNQTKAEYSAHLCIHQMFEAQVERTPDAIALVFEDQQLTYGELNQRANQLAHYLRSLGVGTEILVGIYVERSIEMVIGLLGILKAGGVYLPLDPTYPQERLAYILSTSQVPVLLTQEKLVQQLPENQACIVRLDTDWKVISQNCQNNPFSDTRPENLAYVIYTSGTTGTPKGVMIEHQSLVNFTETAIVEYKLTKSDRVLQFASISFDAAAEEIYPCLTCGGTLILRTDEMLSSQTFLQKCQDLKVTVLDLPTAYWQQLMSVIARDLMLPQSVRLAIIGGEQALTKQIETWQNCVEHQELVNTYGPTEATVVTTIYKLPKAPTNKTLLKLPIGSPIHNVQTYVLDEYLQQVPVGVVGELYISGIGLARGYFNHPDLTANKFIPNPFSHQPGARLYKTGDLVRYRQDANIEFLGRIDNQVKIRGFRIELGEIEAVINQHPSVSASVVILREDEPENKNLVAYITLHLNHTLTNKELRRFLESKLPNYMMPIAFVILKALPLTPNGKVDRKALPIPEIRPELEVAYVMPQTEVEQSIASVWQKALNLEKIGIHDNFFELGGHSLLLVTVHSRLREIFKTDLSMLDMFRYPSISSLAEYLSQINNKLSSFSETDARSEKLKDGKNKQKKRLQKMQSNK